MYRVTHIRAYSKRFDLYRQRIWTCAETGRRQLTFEEAMVCERNARIAAANASSSDDDDDTNRSVDLYDTFPDEFIPFLAPIVHQSTHTYRIARSLA